MTIIGRKAEQELLKQCLDSKKSEFLAIYGRRRVGKTFLVKEAFANQFFFYATGILDENKSLSIQLENFNDELADQGGSEFARAQDWQEAFRNLNRLVEQTPGNAKKVIFLDEIPWMATQNSGFLAALDHFWNRWASSRNDVLLIICGSATSWIIDNVINNRGGLHNRLTRQIQLAPFTLSECEEFFDSNGFVMTHYQIAEAYMIFGGVPYYLSLMNPRQDLNQIVDDVYFRAGAPLQNEFGNLFRSLFRNPSNHVAVVEALASKAKGLKRNEIIEQTGLSDGGGLTRALEELEQCGFIRVYRAFGKALQGKTYQLTDA
ncbi:MAG: AAA family ATPase, partial [Eggerthellaceae bacterium]|nr:AAA family ATPase [Eggerthellaceae bacterium]